MSNSNKIPQLHKAGGTLTATAELNAEKPNLTLNCYWISVHYFSPIFWKFPKKLKSYFHFAETWKADKNPATFERKTVDKTQFDKCRKKFRTVRWNKKRRKKFVEFRCTKFWELNTEKSSEKQKFEKLCVEKQKRNHFVKKSEMNANKKIQQQLTAVWRHCGFCEYLESYALNQNLFIFVKFRVQMPQQQAKPAGR